MVTNQVLDLARRALLPSFLCTFTIPNIFVAESRIFWSVKPHLELYPNIDLIKHINYISSRLGPDSTTIIQYRLGPGTLLSPPSFFDLVPTPLHHRQHPARAAKTKQDPTALRPSSSYPATKRRNKATQKGIPIQSRQPKSQPVRIYHLSKRENRSRWSP
jgi:hypothetical protein